jgi:hypothetical protein
VSHRAVDWAWQTGRDKGLDSSARLVLLALANYANKTSGRCWAAVETLADDTGLGRHAVRAALARLGRAKVVEVERRPGRTSLWIFPPICRSGLSTTGAISGQKSAEIKSAPIRPGRARTLELTLKEPGGARSADCGYFLPGSGWIRSINGDDHE